MNNKRQLNKIALFEGKQIRRYWDERKELWYFAIMDVVETLAQTDRPRKYWNDLKTKLKNEGSELSEKIGQLRMRAADGKYYLTDSADTETMLRLIQSIPYHQFWKMAVFQISAGSVGRGFRAINSKK